MKNLIKYTIGLSVLIIISIVDIAIFILDIWFDFVIKGKRVYTLEWKITKNLLKETWRLIK